MGNGRPRHRHLATAQPRVSPFHLAAARGAELSDISENNAGLWLESEWGKRLPTLYEQVLFQQEGFALLMLWVETAEEGEDEDADERRTSKERYRNRQGGRDRW